MKTLICAAIACVLLSGCELKVSGSSDSSTSSNKTAYDVTCAIGDKIVYQRKNVQYAKNTTQVTVYGMDESVYDGDVLINAPCSLIPVKK